MADEPILLPRRTMLRVLGALTAPVAVAAVARAEGASGAPSTRGASPASSASSPSAAPPDATAPDVVTAKAAAFRERHVAAVRAVRLDDGVEPAFVFSALLRDSRR